MDAIISGSGEFLFAVVGVVILGIALVYGTTMWRKRRVTRRPETIGEAPGPAPKRLEGRDDRSAAT